MRVSNTTIKNPGSDTQMSVWINRISSVGKWDPNNTRKENLQPKNMKWQCIHYSAIRFVHEKTVYQMARTLVYGGIWNNAVLSLFKANKQNFLDLDLPLQSVIKSIVHNWHQRLNTVQGLSRHNNSPERLWPPYVRITLYSTVGPTEARNQERKNALFHQDRVTSKWLL